MIGLLVLELGVERGPDLGLGEGVVVHLEEVREHPTRSTALLRRDRRGGRGGRGGEGHPPDGLGDPGRGGGGGRGEGGVGGLGLPFARRRLGAVASGRHWRGDGGGGGGEAEWEEEREDSPGGVRGEEGGGGRHKMARSRWRAAAEWRG